ncbi:MAG: hypothetical protein KDD19_22815 [Phaeodactylibacter sp.]|nr:hypothetical protein [Phaeodactylibacter sp.]MCB9049396.1 hypothetical protein [Lewinellaceae bacterium]
MKTFFSILISAICLAPGLSRANSSTIFNELKRDGVLKVELALSLSTLQGHIKTEDKQAATFRFTDNQGQPQEWNVDVNVRGRFRRRVCDFPPIKVDFSKKELEARGLLPFDDLKLVTHCQEGSEGEDAVLREYLAYELYSKLTPLNYRTQLVEITYIDTDSDSRFTRYGILLEDTDELAARQNSEECDACYGLSASSINPEVYSIHALFQYMIGNTDWSLEAGRNLKIMKPADGGKYWITPYDFDFSGLVSAEYAVPNGDVGQKFVGQRVYMGANPDRAELEAAVRYFQSKRDELIRYVEEFSLLDKRSRKEVARYLERFFDNLEEKDFIESTSFSGRNLAPVATGRGR